MSEFDDRSGAPPLPRQAQDRIGERLKQMYDSVVREPIPDRFVDLLARLEKTGQGTASEPEEAPGPPRSTESSDR